MPRSPADLLLHPVRLRVLEALLGGEELTTADLAARLPDVPPASLYRHLARLADGGVLQVVQERAVRGATERTYALDLAAGQLGPDAARTMSREEHRKAFAAFAAGLLGRFEHYLEGDDLDPGRDRVSYRQAALWLTDEETDDLVAELRESIVRRMANRPGAGRTRRSLTTVLLPSPPADGSPRTQ